MIELSHFTQPGKDPFLRDIFLTVHSGEIAGIIGRPGSGKSMLLENISRKRNKMPGGTGSITINNRELSKYSGKELSRTVSCFSGHRPDNMDISVEDFLTLSRMGHKSLFRPFTQYDLQVVEECLHYFELKNLKKRRLRELSEVQLKTALLAFTFARQSPLMLLDDPAAGLDIRSQYILSREIIRSVSSGGATVIVAGQDINFVAQIADRIIIMEEGKIAESGTVDLINAETIKRYFFTDVLVSRNIYNGRPLVHLFPGT